MRKFELTFVKGEKEWFIFNKENKLMGVMNKDNKIEWSFDFIENIID